MELHLTGYKVMAPKYATRLDTNTHYNIHKLLARVVGDLDDISFDNMVSELTAYFQSAKSEYQAIYFWVD
jgi:hypothetical protein